MTGENDEGGLSSCLRLTRTYTNILVRRAHVEFDTRRVLSRYNPVLREVESRGYREPTPTQRNVIEANNLPARADSIPVKLHHLNRLTNEMIESRDGIREIEGIARRAFFDSWRNLFRVR